MKRRFQESVLFISVLICLRSVNDSMAVRWRHRSHRTLPVSDISAKNSNSRGHDRKFRIPSPVLLGEDPCRGDDGHPVRCVPDFVNAAFLRKVHTSSVCGTPPSLHCGQPPAPSPGKSVIGNGTGCFLCDSTEPKRSYPAEYLTDLNNPNNPTCWVSALREPQVNISVSLGKKFEMTYISLQFCKSAPRPDSMAILKSVDYGRNWTPLQYFASDCLRFFGKPPGLTASKANEQEAMCSEFPAQLLPNEVARPASYAMPQRVAFVALDGRPSAQDFERSPALQDLVTATDVRIVLEFRQNGIRVRGGQGQLEGSDYFSLSDLAIGGRCKCNGHGHACVAVEEDLDSDDVSHGIDGGPSMRCKCRHNTQGVDCEKCKPFHHDRPWARATPEDPNECTACNCNQHSCRCRFNMELYKASGEGRSGGVCVKCMHNTYGRNCHLCADGFYRDFARPINHRKACRACACHPIGSMGGICNKTTGQCLCKPGVTGQLCNRCAGDFQQSPSPVTPCVKNSEKVESTKPANKEKAPHLKMNGSLCAMHCKDNWNSSMIGLKRFCLKDYVLLQASVLSRNVHNSPSGEWFKYGVDVIDVFNKKQNAISIRPGDHKTVWAAVDDTKVCRCIDLRPRSTYLMMIQPGAAVANGRRRRGGDTRRGLILGRDSIIKQWDDKMSKFMANMECF